MIREKIIKISQFLCRCINSSSDQNTMLSLEILISIIFKAQEISITIDQSSTQYKELNLIYQLARYCFALELNSQFYFTMIVYLILISHLTFIFLFFWHYISEEKESTFSFQVLRYYLIYYSSLIYIPVIYSCLQIFYEASIGIHQIFTQDSKGVFLIISCILNICIGIFIKLVHLYFLRSQTIIGDNNIKVLENQMTFNLIKEILILLSITLKVYQQQQLVRVALVFSKQIISMIQQLNKINCFIHVLIKIVSLITIFGLYFKLKITEYLLLVSLFLYIIIQIAQRIRINYIQKKNQANIITLQLIYMAFNQNSSQQNQIISLIALNLHKCVKCKHPSNLIYCLFKSTVSKQLQLNYLIMFCYYLLEKHPIKSLIKLLKIETSNLYFIGTSRNLIKYLRRQSEFLSELSQNQSFAQKKENNFQTLQTQTVYDCYFSQNQLFPSFEKILIQKINLYNHLIQGYQNIETFINEALCLSENIMQCRALMYQKYDMINERLKNSNNSETLSMRIIQIYYSAIYNNYYLSFKIEKQIDEFLKNERFRQDEPLSSIQLVQNKVFIFQSSLINNRGEFINLDSKKLSQFLEEKEENLKFVKHCSQLMPQFLGNIHDSLIDRYIDQGHPQTQSQSRKTYIQNLEGYVQPCFINIHPHYDQKTNDLIINVIMSKSQQKEMILFGVDGSIYGFTKQFYENATKSNYHFMNIFQYDRGMKNQKEEESNIKQFLEKNPLIQYYIPNITLQVEELVRQYQKTKSYSLTNLKSTWIIPNNHLQCLMSTENLLEPFRINQDDSNKQQNKDHPFNFKQKFDISKSRQVFFDQQNLVQEGKIIDGIPIILLQSCLQSQLVEIVDFGDVSKSQFQLALQYDLQFNSFQIQKKALGYFLLILTDFKVLSTQTIFFNSTSNKVNPKSEVQDDQLSQNAPLNQSISGLNKQEQFEGISEAKQENKAVNDTPEAEAQKEIEYLNFSSANQSFEQNLIRNQTQLISLENKPQIDNVEEKNCLYFFYIQNFILANLSILYRPTRKQVQLLFIYLNKNKLSANVRSIQAQVGPLVLKSKFSENYNIEDIDLNDHKEQMKNQKVSKVDLQINKIKDDKSRSKSRLRERVEFYQNQKEDNNDFASNPSRSSISSTQKETQYLVEQIYSKTQLILPLQKIVIILVLFLISIFIISLVDDIMVVQNLEQQLTGVMHLLEPQNITYFYSSVIYQLWTLQLIQQDVIKISEFQKQRNLETVSSMFQNGRIYLKKLNIQVPKLAQNQGIEQLEIKQVTHDVLSTFNYNVENFYIMLNEAIEYTYRKNLNSPNPYYSELLTSGFIRLNFLPLAKQIDNLVIQIIDNTILRQNQIAQSFENIIIIQLFLVILIIILQVKYWIFIDKIQKSILFLVSHLNENQAIEQIVKLMSVKSILEQKNQNNWKTENFSSIMIENSIKKNTKQKQVDISGKPNSSESALTSRIKKTRHFTKTNYLVILLIIIFWLSYLLTSYILFIQNNKDFQPSLKTTLRYGQFRIKMDIVSVLGGFIKTENLLSNNNLSFINQTETILLFSECKSQLLSIITEVYTTILENANKNNQASPFDNFLNDDICQIRDWDQMKSCDPSKQTLPYSNKDSIHTYVSNGILGYTASLVKYLEQDFHYELNHLHYNNLDENFIDIESQSFQNYFLSYFCDTQDTFLDFLTLFKVDNQNIAESIINLMQIYYLLLGSLFFLIILSMCAFWIFLEQKKMRLLRQILVLIPQEILQNQNMKNRIKLIFRWLY